MKNLYKNLSSLIAIKKKIIKYIIKIIIKYLFVMLILKYCKKIKRIISSTENFMETDKIRFNYLKKNYGYILKSFYSHFFFLIIEIIEQL